METSHVASIDWNNSPLISFNAHFQRLSNLDTLVPLLCEQGILQTTELEALLQYSHRFEKVSFLLTVLDKKGRAGLDGVIGCLKKDDDHIGHQELASILEHHYHHNCYGMYIHCAAIDFIEDE